MTTRVPTAAAAAISTVAIVALATGVFPIIGLVLLMRKRSSETVTRTAVDPAANERITRQSTSTTDDTI